MNIRRTLAGLLSASLLGLIPVATASAPAQAAETYAPTVSVSTNYKKLTYNTQTLFVYAKVNYPAGTYPAGTLSIQRNVGKGWKTVSTNNTAGYHSISMKAKRNTHFRAVYSGGTSYGDTWVGKTSRAIKVNVMRKHNLKFKPRTTLVRGVVKPAYKRKKIVIDRKVGKRWKRFTTVRTSKASKWSKRLPSVRGRTTHFRIIVPAGGGFTKTVHTARTWRY